MSNDQRGESPARHLLIAALLQVIYASSTTAVFFHTAVAEQFGLGATEEKTLLLLQGRGPMTAGEIAQATGLTTASVTSLVDRLERKGFVRRLRDKADRRRVIVEVEPTRLAEFTQLFSRLQGTFDDLFDPYDDTQLTTITDFLTRSVARSQSAIATLRAAGDPSAATPYRVT